MVRRRVFGIHIEGSMVAFPFVKSPMILMIVVPKSSVTNIICMGFLIHVDRCVMNACIAHEHRLIFCLHRVLNVSGTSLCIV